MTTKSRFQTTDLVILVAILAALFYFGYRAIQGESGFFMQLVVAKEERRLTQELASLRNERANLENLTRRLGDSYLDLELLDQQARDVLGYVRADEVIIR